MQDRNDRASELQTATIHSLSELMQTVRGSVILPDNPEYDAARSTHNLMHDCRPAAVIRPADADDVAAAVRYAVQHDLEIAVRGGGHNNAVFGTVDDGIVIDLGSLHDVQIDAAARIAYVDGGARAGDVMAAAQPHGLIVPFGDSLGVGVGGITLGGGVGWLTRKLGMTIDSLLAADVITADGSKLRASETENPDLFWALRGGGGNFGVVTRFEFRLHEIDQIYGGMLILPATRDVVRGVIELSQRAPDGLSTINVVMPLPPMPGVADHHIGKLAMFVQPVWAGDLDAGEDVIAPFLALDEPIYVDLRARPFAEMYTLFGEEPERYTSLTRAFMADALDDEAIDAMLHGLQPAKLPVGSAMALVQIRILGGAMARVPIDATAFAHRGAGVLAAVGAVGFESSELDANRTWADALFRAIARRSAGAYLNFLEDEGDERIRQAYPDATYRRLQTVKRRYDPENRFRLNQNIKIAET